MTGPVVHTYRAAELAGADAVVGELAGEAGEEASDHALHAAR